MGIYKNQSIQMLFVWTGSLLSFAGCLQTRESLKEVEQRQAMQQQVVNLQKVHADSSSRFVEVDEEMRELSGKLDTLQGKLDRRDQAIDTNFKTVQNANADTNKKLEIMQEALGKLETQVQQLSSELELLRNSKVNGNKNSEESKKDGKHNSYDVAQDYFQEKDWKKAILNFEKYREENPKGSKVPSAIYKIGLCFQELKMIDEAKTFYEELIAKYPKSEDARKAKSKLKNLKK